MAEFFNMGGYGGYVWSAFGITTVVLLLNVIVPLRAGKQLMHEIKKKQQRETHS
jgi:heme exporter protein D